MSKRIKCPSCLRPLTVCYCSSIEKVEIPNKILIIRYFKESDHPFNTARMADLSMNNCQVINSNDPNVDLVIDNFIKDFAPFLLFKRTNSSQLVESNEVKAINFIVLDGTWSKARGLLHQSKVLQNLICKHLDIEETSIYKTIRRTCSQEYLSTLEAISKCLELLNNCSYEHLLTPLKRTVELQSKWNSSKT